MTSNDFPAFIEVFSTLSEVFNQEFSEEFYLIYFEDLVDLSLDAVLQAIRKARQSLIFFPKPAELRKLAGAPETCTPSSEELKEQALIAWDHLRRLSGTTFNREALADPITRHVFKQMGGTHQFGTWDYEREEVWKKREFIELYTAYARRQTMPGQLPQLVAHAVLEQIGLTSKALDESTSRHQMHEITFKTVEKHVDGS